MLGLLVNCLFVFSSIVVAARARPTKIPMAVRIGIAATKARIDRIVNITLVSIMYLHVRYPMTPRAGHRSRERVMAIMKVKSVCFQEGEKN